VEAVKAALTTQCEIDHASCHHNLRRRLATQGIQADFEPTDRTKPNMSLMAALFSLMCHEHLSIADMARIVRNEHATDPRPNKELSPGTLAQVYQGYHHHGLLLDMSLHGFKPSIQPVAGLRVVNNASRRSKANHKSADDHPVAISQYIYDGQRNGTLLVLDDKLLDR